MNDLKRLNNAQYFFEQNKQITSAYASVETNNIYAVFDNTRVYLLESDYNFTDQPLADVCVFENNPETFLRLK